MRKKILIIGAGFGQVPAILKAKELGLEVVVIDKNPEAIGMPIADYSYNVDVVDFSQALEVAKEHKINGVMTMQSDLPVPTVGYINDNLGLQGVSLEVANFCSNKIETRKRLAEKNCDQPKFQIVQNFEQALEAVNYVKLPCVIKAPDSSGSRGVVKVSAVEEIKEALSEAFKYSRGNQVLVEEYISGLEFGAQTFSENGECKLVLMHNDTISAPPYMIPIGHSFPFKYLSPQERSDAEASIKKAIEALGIINGPANVDLILDEKTKTVKIIEIGARIGATCLPELVEYHSGISWVEVAIKNAIGEKCDLKINKNQAVAALILESPKDGKFKGFKINNKSEEFRVVECEVTPCKGENVYRLRKGTDRIGKVVALGMSADEAEQNALNFSRGINIFVDEE
jgi:carbamoylphosphate synthase large subunit